MVAIADFASHLMRNRSAAAARGLLAILLLGAGTLIGTELFVRYKDYFSEYPRRESTLQYYQYGLEQVLGYAHQHENEYDEIWITDTNQPYIYVLFYTRWPPSDVHQHLHVLRGPPAFNEVDAIRKYYFRDSPDVSADELVSLYTVHDPSGGIAYEVRGGSTKDRGRVLLVHRP
jgi:hypothetical protein